VINSPGKIMKISAWSTRFPGDEKIMLSTSGQDNGGVFPQEERTIGDFNDK
jgi:hypothetical protein